MTLTFDPQPIQEALDEGAAEMFGDMVAVGEMLMECRTAKEKTLLHVFCRILADLETARQAAGNYHTRTCKLLGHMMKIRIYANRDECSLIRREVNAALPPPEKWVEKATL